MAVDLGQELLNSGDDEIIELWYIIGVAALSCQPPDIAAAFYHLEHAREMIEALQEAGANYKEQLDLVMQHLSLIDMNALAALEKEEEEEMTVEDDI